jgi:transposase
VIEKHPRTRIRFIGLSHIPNGKSYEQVVQYLLQSLSAVKQWVRHYKDEGPLSNITLKTMVDPQNPSG